MKRIPTKRDKPRRERPELFYKPSDVVEQFHTPTLRKMISRKRATPRTKKELGLTHNRRGADVRDEIRDMLIPPPMPNTGIQCKERACPFPVHQDDKCLKHWRDSQTDAELLRELK